MIPFSLVVDVGELGAEYVAFQLMNRYRGDYDFAVTSAVPVVGIDYDRGKTPFSIQVDYNPTATSVEYIRRELLKFGPYFGFQVKQAYPIPDFDPRVIEAIEWVAYDAGELPS